MKFVWAQYLHSFALDEATFHRVANAMFLSDDWEAGDLGLISTQEWLLHMIDNSPQDEIIIRKVFADFGKTIESVPITVEWIQYFRNRSFRIFYLSNYSHEMMPQ